MRGTTNREGDDLFRLAKGADLEERFRVMEELGRVVGEQHTERFESLVGETVRSGTVDVTGWSQGAIRVLLIVAGERGIKVTFKNGDKFTTPVKYVAGTTIDLFAEGSVNGEW